MGTADMLFFALLVLANMALLAHLQRRWQRLSRLQRMSRSLRLALVRESAPADAISESPSLLLQAS
jgi:hypothetical protein